jgi:hypothetical protein
MPHYRFAMKVDPKRGAIVVFSKQQAIQVEHEQNVGMAVGDFVYEIFGRVIPALNQLSAAFVSLKLTCEFFNCD